MLTKFSKIFSIKTALILFCAGFLFFGLTAKVEASTYYVDNTCSNNGDGTTQTCASSPGTAGPFNTIAAVNSMTCGSTAGKLNAGDSVLFKTGNTFREQLTVPCSGTSASQITFGNYGGGLRPVITGTNLIASWTQGLSGWTQYQNTSIQQSQTNKPANGNLGNAASQKIWAQTFTASGSYSVYSVIVGLSKGGAPTDNVWAEIWSDSSGNPGSIITNGQSNTLSGSSLTTSIVDHEFTFSTQPSLTTGTVYHLVLRRTGDAIDSTNYYHFAWETTGGTGLQKFTPWSNSGVTTYAMYYKINSGTGPVANVYQTTLTSSPSNIYFDGTTGTSEASIAALTADNEWYWSSNVLYVYSATTPSGRVITNQLNVWQTPMTTQTNYVLENGSVGNPVTSTASLAHQGDWVWSGNILYLYSTSNPASVYTTPGVEAGQRDYCVLLDGKNYITIDGLNLYGANGLANLMFNTYLNPTSIGGIVQNSEVHHGKQTGIYLWGTTNGILRNNYIHHIWNGLPYGNGGDTGQGISIYDQTAVNNLITNNWIDSNFRGVFIFGAGGTLNPQGTQITYNLVSNSMVNDIDQFQTNAASSPTLIYNNTVIHNPTFSSGHGIDIQDVGADGIKIKNNIIYSSYTGTNVNVQLITLTSYQAMSSVDVDNNLYFLAPGSTAFVGKDSSGTTYSTFASWQSFLQGTTYAGKDANSVNADPKFTDLSSNFTLLSSSPAIDHGISLGDTYKLGLNPNSVWPGAVNTLDQTLNGPGWEMGAYVYTQSTAPTISITAPSAGFASSSIAVTASASATLPATISSVQFYLDGVALQSADTTFPYSITWDTTTATNASHTLTAVATDNYTNTTTSAGVVVTVDNLGPTGTISNGNGTPTNSITPTFNLTIADAGVGITGAQMQFSCNNSTWSTWENYATPKTNFNIKTGEGCVNSDGSKTVYVKYKDSLGNIGSSYNTGAFTLDTSASFATLSGTPASITKSTSASVTVAGTNIVSYEYKLDSGSYGTETLIATPISLSGLADGSHTLSVIGKNSAGTWQVQGSATTYTWTVDTTTPVVTFTIPSTSNSLTVTFTSFSATDANGVTGYLVNETATTPDVSDAGWAGTAQTQYVFTTEGAKTLYAWAKDGVGNISTSGSGTVTVTLPVVVSGGGPLITGSNGPIVGSLGGHRQDVSNLLAPTIPVTSTTTNISGCNNRTSGFSTTTGQSCLGNTGGITTSTTPLPKYNFTRNLSLHSTGKDVKALQQYLNTNGFVIAKTGAGSPGKETTLFGTMTYKALVKYQKSLGWSGTGFFGPLTRSYINTH